MLLIFVTALKLQNPGQDLLCYMLDEYYIEILYGFILMGIKTVWFILVLLK